MQDDLLMDKSKAQPYQHQDPSNTEPPSTPTPSEPPILDEQNHVGHSERVAMESPVLPGLGFPQESSLSPSFGSTWSTNTVDEGYFQGIPSVNGTMLFQNFPHHVNPVFGGSFSPQMRRSPMSLNQRNPYSHQTLINKVSASSASSSAWNNHQNAAWSSAANPWSGRDPRQRALGLGVPSPLNPISPTKKPFPSNVIAPPKYQRPGAMQKPWMISEPPEPFRTDNSNNMLPFQERNRPFDPFSLQTLENSLMDMIMTDHDKGRMGLNFHHPVAEHILPPNSRSSLFPFEDGFLDEGHGDPALTPGLSSPSRCQNGERMERYSRKVFVGGLPPDIDEDEITNSFRRYGHLVVDWPHKAESKSYFPPKGYAFLLFQEESSVQALIDACIEEDGKLYLCVSSPTIKDKPVQIRPWNLSDSDFVMDGSQPLDPRKTIFVGGVPRPLRAVELAMIMDRLYGGVCYAGIDTDPELKYPKGAGRVAFSNQQSYIAAISARFVQLQHNDIDKRVEVKPYVLDDQMCDECQGARCGGKFAPFFCANVTCLQYYCEYCWASIHSRAGREFHKPLVKEGGDRPRHVSFRWS
ncbi:cytoplasmic polyadenylation element-binding protein [Pimephales promelas]|nr:cytoplasmic polyadenylation element-binding protein [Pimephales promelas]KAG1950440.1 cytoplasmic polyadenylation element-binding protein [Pimephales promelas]KAG1950442.1 cytoplasmic polyadenylation element-binding protein [Pimephales promelas]KAG1950444.1 cytoplasmic polyadenylation element-binding protein [Pimephales promelas]KAG1950446.1 cytoplasmic polyadenylation element-binding protein [Pimephales promelas]